MFNFVLPSNGSHQTGALYEKIATNLAEKSSIYGHKKAYGTQKGKFDLLDM
jgi:hypothetical protein